MIFSIAIMLFAQRLSCTGAGAPTVILEAGAGGDAASWRLVQPAVAKLTRVCSHDRGLERGGEKAIDDLHELLTKAYEDGPYV